MAQTNTTIEKIGEPPIGRLPIEVLDKVFSFLNPWERQRLRSICRKWRNAFDVFQEIGLAVTNTNWKFLKNCRNITLNVSLQSFTRTLDSHDPMTKDFVSKIRILVFSGAVVPYNIASVFKECLNLETIGFESCKLFHSDERYFMDEFSEGNKYLPPKLKTFKYKSPDDRDENGCLLSHLREILHDANLRHFEFHLSTDEAMDLLTGIYIVGQCSQILKVSRSCRGIMKDHKKILRSLSLLGKEPLRFTFSDQNIGWPPLVTALEVSTCLDFPCIAFPTHIMSLFLAPILRDIKKLKIKLHKQPGLWTVVCECAQTFGERMEEVSCVCEHPGLVNIQCDGLVFSRCLSLRKLEMIGAAAKSPFVNVDRLPSSLRILRTSVVLTYPGIDFNEIHFDNLKQLQELDISSKSFFELQSGEVQMTKENLEHLLKSLTSLRKLKVKNVWLNDKDTWSYIQNSSDLRLRTEGGVGIITVLKSFQSNHSSL